jgi:hypothetical protein
LDVDAELLNNKHNRLKLKKWILTAIEEQVRKNNVFVVSRMVQQAAKKAQIFKRDCIVTVAIPAKL